MTFIELRTIVALASIFSFRMLGLFMVLPVFAIYAKQLNHATPTTIGIALGIYGLTQTLFQIPFGAASDRLGRKPVIIFGLLLFILGSIMAALSQSIEGVIIGRSLQGASAIGCVIMALVADLIREKIRMRAMAAIGITIGLSFALAMILGPLLSELGGVQGIFWITAILSCFAILMLVFFVPTPTVRSPSNESIPLLANIPKIITNSSLIPLNFGVLVIHASLTAMFLKIPSIIQFIGYTGSTAWRFYVPIFAGSFLVAIFCILVMEKKSWVKLGTIGMILALVISELGILYFSTAWLGVVLSVGLFFTAFNTLEASLPSWVSKVAPAEYKGTALGVYSSAQFLGLFLGGIIGGWLDSSYGMVAVLLFCILLAVVWLTLFLRQLILERFFKWHVD
jgi:MFS family permease